MNSDIVLSRELLQRLVIIDDSTTTYNAYKSKFYLNVFKYVYVCFVDNTIRID